MLKIYKENLKNNEKIICNNKYSEESSGSLYDKFRGICITDIDTGFFDIDICITDTDTRELFNAN